MNEDNYPESCPKCGSKEQRRTEIDSYSPRSVDIDWVCDDCGFEWREVYYFKEWYEK